MTLNAMYGDLEREFAAGLNGVKFIEYAGTARLGDGTDAGDVYVDPAKRMYPTFPLVNIYNEADGTTTTDQAVPWYPGLTMDNSQRHMEVFLVRFPFLNPKLKWVFGFTEIGLSAWNGVTPLQAGVANAAVVTYDKIYPHAIYPAGGLAIGYRGGWIRRANRRYLVPGSTLISDISSHDGNDYRPASADTSRWIRLSVSTAGVVSVVQGSEFDAADPSPRNYQPVTVPDGYLDLGAVLVTNGDTDLAADWGAIADPAPDIFTIPAEGATFVSELEVENFTIQNELIYGNTVQGATIQTDMSSDGFITPDRVVIAVHAASGTADDLYAIGNPQSNKVVILTAAAGDTITVKHGAENIYTADEADFVLTDNLKMFFYSDGADWFEMGRVGGTIIGSTITVEDNQFTLQDNGDTTKQGQFQLSGITAGQTRILTFPNFDGTIATLAGTETFTNKTLTSPVISGGTINNAVIGGTTAAAGTFTALTIDPGTAAATLTLNPDNVQNRNIFWQTNGANRWRMFADGAVAESGSNVGSDFYISRYSDAGAETTVVTISRATGAVGFTGNFVTVNQDAAAAAFLVRGATAQSANLFVLQDVSANNEITMSVAGGAVFNEQGNNADHRIEGDTDQNMFFGDASADSIGIGTATPSAKLDVATTTAGTNTAAEVLVLQHQSSATPTTSFGVTMRMQAHSSTNTVRNQFRITSTWVVATDASRTALVTFSAFDTGARECIRIQASGTAPMIGFYGVAAVARPAAYTQTYSTTTRTVNPASTAAFTGIDNAQGGTPYAQLTDLNALRGDVLQLAQLINSLIDDHQSLGLAQ